MASSGYQSYPDPAHNHGGYNQSQYPAKQGAGAGADGYNSVGPSVVSPYSPNLSPHFSGTTMMLTILAIVSLYEGTLRVIQHANSDATWDTSYRFFPAAAVLIGGIWEALYSLITLFVALWALLFDWHSVALTTLALLTQLGGWYTVVVFSLAEPSYNYDHRLNNSGQVFSVMNSADQTRATYVFGWIFPMFFMNTAVLAGLMFFTIQLLQIQTNKVDELHSPRYYSRRLGFWALLELMIGISQIIFAGLEIDHNTDSRLANPLYFYPNFTTYATIVLITGILFTLSGIMAFISCCAKNLHISNMKIALEWLTFLWVVGAHVMGQCGVVDQFVDGGAAGYGMSELGMLFGTLLIPMFLAYKAATIETVHRGHYMYGPQQNYNNRPMVV